MCCSALSSCFRSIFSSCSKPKNEANKMNYSSFALNLSINSCYMPEFHKFFVDLLSYKVIFESFDRSEVVYYNPNFSKNLFIRIKITNSPTKAFADDQQLIFYLNAGCHKICELLQRNGIISVESESAFLKLHQAKVFKIANNFRVIFFPEENISEGKIYKMRICSHGLNLAQVARECEQIGFRRIDSFRQPDGYHGDMYAPAVGEFDCHIEFTQSIHEKSEEDSSHIHSIQLIPKLNIKDSSSYFNLEGDEQNLINIRMENSSHVEWIIECNKSLVVYK